MTADTNKNHRSAINNSQQVQHRKQEDPDKVDEMPVESGELDAVRELVGVLAPQSGAGADEVRHHDHAAEELQPVKPRQREIDSQERAVPRPFAANEVA